jgi:membrane protein implicated in regulation of membrane protease activity
MFEWLTPQLVWFAIGVILILLEFMVPGVILVFFGIGAILTAALSWFGILPGPTWQLIFFCVSSLGLLFGLRKYFSKFFKGDVAGEDGYSESREYAGEKARVTTAISPNSPDGRIQFEGTEWKAVSSRYIPEGEIVEIVEKKNITFTVKQVSGRGAE